MQCLPPPQGLWSAGVWGQHCPPAPLIHQELTASRSAVSWPAAAPLPPLAVPMAGMEPRQPQAPWPLLSPSPPALDSVPTAPCTSSRPWSPSLTDGSRPVCPQLPWNPPAFAVNARRLGWLSSLGLEHLYCGSSPREHRTPPHPLLGFPPCAWSASPGTSSQLPTPWTLPLSVWHPVCPPPPSVTLLPLLGPHKAMSLLSCFSPSPPNLLPAEQTIESESPL